MAGKIFIISAPSGTGKTTVISKVVQGVPNLVLSVSTTTRSPRPGEKEGVDYHFVNEDSFNTMIKRGEFVEWASVHGHLYGTSKQVVNGLIKDGKHVLLDIDVQGAEKFKKTYPFSVTIFILPPSFDDLAKRLSKRGTEPKEEIEKRVKDAEEEYKRRHEYDYQVVNENIDEAASELIEIINYYTEE